MNGTSEQTHCNNSNTIPKSDIDVLNQEIDNKEGRYRIRARKRVHYLTIPTTVFDEDTMCIPSLLIPQLPDFPDDDWTKISISRPSATDGGPEGALEFTISFEPLSELQQWSVHEVLYKGRPAIAKYSRFEYENYRLERESASYYVLHHYHNPDNPPIAPKFLGHLTENGRVMGLLLERLEGQHASIEDLAEGEKVVRVLHDEPVRLVHGDLNRYNFVVNKQERYVRLIDFEHAEDYDEEKARLELASLPSELVDESGRGAEIEMVRE